MKDTNTKKRSAEKLITDEDKLKALNSNGSKQIISDSKPTP